MSLFIYVVDLLWSVSIQERRSRSTYRSLYRLFLTFWDAILSCFHYFFPISKRTKIKTRRNQQYDLMITIIGENGSHVPCASRLLHHTNYLFPLFWRWGIKQKKHDFICRCSVFSLSLLRIYLQSLFSWNCVTLQVSSECF